MSKGGTFILECQSFSTYKKKKKLTEAIFNNFKNIKLKPENFTDFLIHEVIIIISHSLMMLKLISVLRLGSVGLKL